MRPMPAACLPGLACGPGCHLPNLAALKPSARPIAQKRRSTLDGHRHLGEMKTLSQRNMLVEERAQRIQQDLSKHAKDLDARDPRNTVHAEMMSYGIRGQYIAMVAGRFGELSKGFIKLRDYSARQRAYAYNEHFNS